MTNEIGVVQAIMGSVSATAMNGAISYPQVGDTIFANDLITTGADGAIEIEFADGEVMDLGYTSQVILDSQFFDSTASFANDDQVDINEIATTMSFLVAEQGDDILSGNDSKLPQNLSSSNLKPVLDDLENVVYLADVLSNPDNQIIGVENEGHLQIQVSNSGGVIQLINLTSMSVVDDVSAQNLLDNLLSDKPVDDGMS